MPLTVIPNGAVSAAKEKVSVAKAPFDVVYAVPAVIPPVLEATEQVLMILPHLRRFIAGMTAWHR
jgi:hypothetical protein